MAFAVTEGLHGAEVQARFKNVYEATQRRSNAMLSLVCDLGVPSSHRQETYGYIEAAPHVELWTDAIPEEGMGSKTVTVVNYKFGKRVKWKREDRADEMTGSLMGMVEGVAASAGLLDERLFFDLLLATTNTLPATVNGADGAAFHATTAGGANRFGVSSGNLLSANGVATSAAIRQDFWLSVAQGNQFQDGKGQPLWPDGVTNGPVVILYGSANEEIFREAFKQSRTVDGNNTPTSTPLESGIDIRLWSTPRITDNDWFVFFTGVGANRAAFVQEREGLEERFADAANSDVSRDLDIEYMQVRLRKGAGILLPYQTVKNNN